MWYVPVQGTNAWTGTDKDKGCWWHPESVFAGFMRARGWQIYVRNADQFYWSTDIDGIFWQFWKRKRVHKDWDAGGQALSSYLHDLPVADRRLIAHSHGGQVVAYACGKHALAIHTLITIGTPVRDDMEAMYQAAKARIGYWLHIHATDGDRMQAWGEWLDGTPGIRRKMSAAHANLGIPKIGHSKVLHDPQIMKLWDVYGWLRRLGQ